MRLTSAKSANNATPAQPTAAPSTRDEELDVWLKDRVERQAVASSGQCLAASVLELGDQATNVIGGSRRALVWRSMFRPFEFGGRRRGVAIAM